MFEARTRSDREAPWGDSQQPYDRLARREEERLAELLREVERHRGSIREFGLAGYATIVERHQAKLREVYNQVRRHCKEHGLDLPRGIPKR